MSTSGSGQSTARLWRQHDELAQKSGKRATVYDPKGTHYTGEWKNNRYHGNGVFMGRNGVMYEGEWADGQRHGQGTLWLIGKDRVQRKRYVGAWKSDRKHGFGTFFYPDGSRYEGEWMEDVRAGWGTFYSPAGDRYEGEWSADMRNGFGSIQFANGDVFEGHFLNDLKEGKGTFTYAARKQRYDGEWVHDVPKCGALTDIVAADERRAPPPGHVDDARTYLTKRRFLPELGLADPDDVLSEAISEVHALREQEFVEAERMAAIRAAQAAAVDLFAGGGDDEVA